MSWIDFHYIKTGTGELSGPSFVTQTEQAINELGDYFENVEGTANSALSQAQAAQQAASDAQQTANSAVSQAQQAQASADTAQQAANQAQTTADNALEAAQNAGDEAGTKAPIMHASSATTYGVGSSTLYGHVQLSDSTNSAENAASGGTAATPYAVAQAMTAAQTAQSAANSAQQVGNSAQQTANQAQTAAETAQNTANSVQTSLNQAVENFTQQITALTQMQDFVVTDTAIDVENSAGSFSKLYLTSSASTSTGLPAGITYPCYFWTETTQDGNTSMMFVLSGNVLYSQSGVNTTPDGDTPTWSFTGWQQITYTAATTSALGVVKPDGTTVEVAADGTISVPEYTGMTAGLVPPAGNGEGGLYLSRAGDWDDPSAALRQSMIGMIAPFASTSLPEGWMICDGSSVLFADWPEFEQVYNEGRFTGMVLDSADSSQVGKMVLNGSSGVYLPDLEGLFVQASASDTAGAYVAPGLPNVIGFAGSTHTSATTPVQSGALYWGGTYLAYNNLTASGTGYPSKLSIDASRVSDVYSNSVDTVQPPSVQYVRAMYLGKPATAA